MEKKNYLSLCNDQGLSEEAFRQTFCQRCLQPECERSQHGTSKFERRTMNWLPRLFTEVPRLDPSDPRYAEVAGAKFVDPAETEGGSWKAPIAPERAPHLFLANTPHPPPLLPGAPPPSPSLPPSDPWAAPIPAAHDSSAGPVVRRGARIKFGPDGVE